jgi:hypothetical protein
MRATAGRSPGDGMEAIMKSGIAGVAACVTVAVLGSALVMEAPARLEPPAARATPNGTGALAEQLRENVALHRPLPAAARLLEGAGRAGAEDVLAAEAHLIEALDLLNRVTGEAREELLELRTRRAGELEAAMARTRRLADSGRASAEDVAAISRALARERVAVFELMR